jgi:tetratricopeptide (TPR) repeat protein
MQKYEEALEYLIIASKNLPQNSRVDYNIAMLYEFFGDLSKAEQYLDLAVQKEPNSIQNQNNLMEFRRKHNLK